MANAVKILKHYELPKEAGDHFRLVCLTGKNKGQAYFFHSDRIVLGRAEGADIRVHDIKSSREHAEIVKVKDRFVITDLGSQNGILVNDIKVKQHYLKNGDLLVIGSTAYKFNHVVVEDKSLVEVGSSAVSKNEKNKKDEKKSEDEKKEEEKKKAEKKKKIILIVGFLFVVTMLMEDEPEVIVKKKEELNYKVDEVSDTFVASLQKKKQESKKNKEKLEIYYQKGLREFREGNFFRAIAEFEHALAWSPNDSLAQFYLRRTKDKLNKTIEKMFIQAKRSEDSLKYKSASLTYCKIIRLLFQYPEDDRYKSANEGVRRMEVKLGLDENEIKCLEGFKD